MRTSCRVEIYWNLRTMLQLCCFKKLIMLLLLFALLSNYLNSLPKHSHHLYAVSLHTQACYWHIHVNVICPQALRWKVALIKCLIHRVYLKCSSWRHFTKEMEYMCLKTTFGRKIVFLNTFSGCVWKVLWTTAFLRKQIHVIVSKRMVWRQ